MKPQHFRNGILYVDDEEKSLKYFEAIFSDLAPIYTASSPGEGFEVFTENHERIALVLSDKKMPNESGLDLLERMREFDPKPFRILVTAFADLNVAVEQLNDGLLYSYLTKPWDPLELEQRLSEALRHFFAMQDRERLVEEKEKMVKQLVMADRASGIGILSRGLNHHLRNSLTVLRTFFDMLPYQIEEEFGEKPGDSEFWDEYLGEVGSQIEKMTGILSNLAEGSENRIRGDIESFDLVELVESSLQMIDGRTERVEQSFSAPSGKLKARGEKAEISQMVRMLVIEARKNVGDEGRVEIRLEEDAELSGATLTVVDDGAPIPEEEKRHLFDPFFVRSDKPEEVGMNLLACYMTVFRHGGQICACEDDMGRNVIEVRLPSEPPAESADLDFLRAWEGGRAVAHGETALSS